MLSSQWQKIPVDLYERYKHPLLNNLPEIRLEEQIDANFPKASHGFDSISPMNKKYIKTELMS